MSDVPSPQVPAAQSRATISLVLGILSMVICPLIGPFAIWLGLSANSRLRAAGAQTSGAATAGFILGILGTLFILLFVPIVAAIAIPGFLSASSAANERNASANLKSMVSVQMMFRVNDYDQNNSNDFWVGDVAGLYRIAPKSGGGAIRLIEASVALADASPMQSPPPDLAFDSGFPTPGAGWAPKAGYYYRAIPSYYDEMGKTVRYHQGGGRNPDRFAICAYPSRYGSAGRMTIVIDESGSLYRMDTGGKPVDVWPSDPSSRGWSRWD
jgi:hypothetical protein